MRIQCKLYEMLFRLGFNNKITAIIALRKGFSQGNIKIVGQGAEYGITRLKGIWILGALLYLAGGIMVFLCAHLIFYYLVADTHYVFIPGIIGFSLWSALCLCLLWQNVFLRRGV